MSPGLLNKEGPPRRSSGTVPPLPQLLVAEPSPAPPWWPCPGGTQLRGLPLLSFFSLSACCPPHPASRKPESVSNKSPQLHRAGSGCCWPWAVPCCLPSPFQAGKRPRPPSLLVPPESSSHLLPAARGVSVYGQVEVRGRFCPPVQTQVHQRVNSSS